MKAISTITGLVLAAGMATSASAGTLLASDPQTFMTYFFDEGIPAQLTKDGVGDPLIEIRKDGEKFSLFFYDCTDNAACLAVQFYSGYKTNDPVSLETINQWNTDRRFVRAYLTDEGASRIEMDIATGWEGVSSRDFGELFSLWMESISLFEERIDW